MPTLVSGRSKNHDFTTPLFVWPHRCPPLLGLLVLSGTAQAQQIGSTTVAQNTVSRLTGAQRNALAVGESVSRDEAVQTGADSLAKIVFLDQTNLSIGPNARVSLD